VMPGEFNASLSIEFEIVYRSPLAPVPPKFWTSFRFHHVWDFWEIAGGLPCKLVLRSRSPVRALSDGNYGCSSDSACRMHLRRDAGLNGRLR
jgi:hypothetical protein